MLFPSSDQEEENQKEIGITLAYAEKTFCFRDGDVIVINGRCTFAYKSGTGAVLTELNCLLKNITLIMVRHLTVMMYVDNAKFINQDF